MVLLRYASRSLIWAELIRDGQYGEATTARNKVDGRECCKWWFLKSGLFRSGSSVDSIRPMFPMSPMCLVYLIIPTYIQYAHPLYPQYALNVSTWLPSSIRPLSWKAADSITCTPNCG